jgi:sugar (pentulose or hexulose) kinase
MDTDQQTVRGAIEQGRTFLGIELGSTRIKAVLIGEDYVPIASGGYGWENKLENGIWTYDLEDVWAGLRESFSSLSQAVKDAYGVSLRTCNAMGISGMMVGYLVFDQDDRQLIPFRTWRNTITSEASKALTELFRFNLPQRWSIAHLYQAMLNGESHVNDIALMTTLSGYVHRKLTGWNVVGVGEASGILPVDEKTCDYNERMVEQFNNLLAEHGIPWKLRDVLPASCRAGSPAGVMNEEGARLLDPSGQLQSLAWWPPIVSVRAPAISPPGLPSSR